jgi:hypothetical protein
VYNTHVPHAHAEREFGGLGAVEFAQNFLDLVDVFFRGLDVDTLRVRTVVWTAIVDLDKAARDLNADLLCQFFPKFFAVRLTG